MNTSSTPTAESTTWWIDTTADLGTSTITTTFQTVVLLHTTLTPTPLPSATAASSGQNTTHTGIVVGTTVGCICVVALVAALCLFYRLRHARPQFRLYQSDPAKALDSNQSASSAQALLDLAAGPEPHPANIEPWVAPATVHRSGKVRPRDEPTEVEMREQAPVEPARPPIVERPHPAEPSRNVQVPLPIPTPAARTLQLVQHDNAASGSSPSTGHNTKSIPPQPQSRRRRAQREPSPPRLEEDAGVSLMRAGDETPLPLGDEPPSYHFVSGSVQ